MIPLCDQQSFLLQLGKLHRHGGAFHAEKNRKLLTVKGNIKEDDCPMERMSLSVKNSWLDGQGRVYIIFPIQEVDVADRRR